MSSESVSSESESSAIRFIRVSLAGFARIWSFKHQICICTLAQLSSHVTSAWSKKKWQHHWLSIHSKSSYILISSRECIRSTKKSVQTSPSYRSATINDLAFRKQLHVSLNEKTHQQRSQYSSHSSTIYEREVIVSLTRLQEEQHRQERNYTVKRCYRWIISISRRQRGSSLEGMCQVALLSELDSQPYHSVYKHRPLTVVAIQGLQTSNILSDRIDIIENVHVIHNIHVCTSNCILNLEIYFDEFPWYLRLMSQIISSSAAFLTSRYFFVDVHTVLLYFFMCMIWTWLTRLK